MITPEQLIAGARSLVGTPYVHQGHTRHGVDCIGFIFVAAEVAGLKILDHIPRPKEKLQWNYSRRPQALALERMTKYAPRTEGPEPGGLIFFMFPKAKYPQHFAIYTGETIIHAHAMRRQVVEHGYRAQWVRFTHSFWRLPGVRYA